VEFSILGPLEAMDDGASVDLAGGKQRALLAFLLLQAGRVVPMDRLVDGLWGEKVPESAPKMVQIFVSQLRKRLPLGLIETRSPGYRLELDGHTLDLHVFEALHARGREALADGRPDEAARELRRALDVWRGVPLAEFAEPFARLEEARLAEQQLTCVEECLDAELALGREAELVAELEALVRRHPLRERPRAQLMLALYRSGRQADALEAFQSFRRTLDDELGIDPSPRLKELQRRMLQQDRSLDLVPTERAPVPDAPLAAPAPVPAGRTLPESRRLVTVLVADVGPTHALDDPEAQRAALLERTRAVEQALTRHGASVAPFGSGRVLGVFGVPTAQDDDSLRAVTAAVALRSSGLATRVGLSTGEVVTGDPLVAGAPVDEAARFQERAGAGDVLASPRTWRAVRHAVEATPREEGWAVDAVDARAPPMVRHLETPLVGRERELREVTKEFESAVAAGVPRLVTVFGAPGLGKTRLAVECVERLERLANAAVTHCRADGRDATYAPLRDLLTELADGDPAAWLRRRLGTDDAPHLADQLAVAVGLQNGTAHAQDAALATRRLLAALARERPLLLVLEDVHWAAPAFLDLVESLVELAHASILVLCLARPDLLDLRPNWGGGRVRGSTILLDALPAAESETLLDLLSSNGRLDAAARRRILETAEGNPLFIEQLLAAALEGELDTLPDSIQMLLAARLDRLDDADRAVVQAAAVCGTSFTSEEVSALVGGDVEASLVTLVRRELIRPGEAEDAGRGGWSFRHALVRDAAYAGVPKRRRAELHERLAERALEAGMGGDASSAHHLDSALRARVESGERGAAVERLAEQAAVQLRRAGLAATDRDDWFAAVSLLARACELLPRDAHERAELLPKLAEALTWRGEHARAREVFAEAQAVATELGDARLAARARLATMLALMWRDDALTPERMLRDVEEAVPVLEQAGDHGAMAMAELVRFHAFDRGGMPNPEQRLSVALEHARKAGDGEIEHRVLNWICITLPGGAVPVDEAIAQVEDIARAFHSAHVHASARGALGLLLAASGEFEQARPLVEETRRALEELGLWVSAASHSIAIAEVELMAGDDAAAERVLRAGFETLDRSDDELSKANVAWRLGLLLARHGRDDEAEPFARIAERIPTPGLWVGVWWRVVLAFVEAYRGDSTAALRHIREARAAIASASGPRSRMEADALIACSDVLRSVGRTSEAAALLGEAAAIAEQLGYVVARLRAEDAQRALTA
jgi:DNA-binding SARP family transcriptional activator